MVRDGKPKGFFYLDHRTVQWPARHHHRHLRHTRPMSTNSIVYLGRLDRPARALHGFNVDHRSAPGCLRLRHERGHRGLEERGIPGVIGYRRPTPPRTWHDGRTGRSATRPRLTATAAPQGQLLNYATTDRNGYRHYKSNPTVSRSCPLLASCTSSRNATRLITHHPGPTRANKPTPIVLLPRGKRIYKRRKETVERSFPTPNNFTATATPTSEVCWLSPPSACSPPPAQNIKKIALALAPKPVWA